MMLLRGLHAAANLFFLFFEDYARLRLFPLVSIGFFCAESTDVCTGCIHALLLKAGLGGQGE